VAELDLETDTLAVVTAESIDWEVIVIKPVNNELIDTVADEVIWLLVETVARIEEVIELWGVFV
jgi:hypothetical protein